MSGELTLAEQLLALMPAGAEAEADDAAPKSPSFEEPSPKRAMPPEKCVSLPPSRRPLAELTSAPGGTTTTGQGARLETSAEMLPSSDERGPVEPTTIIDAFSAAAAATSRSAGWPTSTSQPAPQSTSVAPLEILSSRSAMAPVFGSGAPSSTTQTKTNPSPSLLLKPRATRAAPLADSESSTPQIIEPAIKILLRSSSWRLSWLDRDGHRAGYPSRRRVASIC